MAKHKRYDVMIIHVIQKHRKLHKAIIFRILQDLVTKFWNFTTFKRFFREISFFLAGFA